MIRSAITRASFRACLDDGPVLAALVSVRLLLSCSCIRGDVTRDTNLTLSFAALFSHSACVLYSRRSGNPNPKWPGAAPRKANRRRRRLDSRPAGPHSRDERSEGCIGVSDPQNPRRRSWLEPNCEHGSEHYIHHPASTVAHRSAIDTPPREADAVITRRGNYVRAHLCAPHLSGWHQLLCRILSLTCLPPGRWPSSCRLAARTSNTAGRLCPSVYAQDGDRGTR